MYFLVYKFEKGQPVDVSDPSAIVAKLHYENDETMSYYDKDGRKGDFTYAVTAGFAQQHRKPGRFPGCQGDQNGCQNEINPRER